MADDKQKLIDQFCAISGVDAERSKFFLESAAWNIEAALGSLYEEGDHSSPAAPPAAAAAASNTESSQPPKPLDMPKLNVMDSESSEEEGEAFYAGGSEHSGQQVLGPSKKKKDVVSMLFKSAKDHGAELVESKEMDKKKKKNFAGAGYRLGETDDDHEEVGSSSKKDESPKDVTLRMWKTGFTVDSGPLRQYDDPQNHEFLASVKRGQVPPELVRSARGGEVFINMEDHRHEDYLPAKQKIAAFTGSGQALGSPAPTVVGQVLDTGTPGGSIAKSVTLSSSSSAENGASQEEKAKQQLNLDSAKPVTSIQIRLPDGSRLILKLNQDHTVSDIRQYVVTARPNLPQTFTLMTTFPFAEVKEDAKTLKEANLLNSALVLK